MKNNILLIILTSITILVNAQETRPSLQKGTWMLETNFTPFGSYKTGFSYSKSDNDKNWSIGASTGYFIYDKLAIKAGLGYSSFASTQTLNYNGSDFSLTLNSKSFNYEVGAKYYIQNQIPIALTLNGSKVNAVNSTNLAAQVGYAWFVKDNIAIEPAVQYGLALNDNSNDVLSLGIGFSVHF